MVEHPAAHALISDTTFFFDPFFPRVLAWSLYCLGKPAVIFTPERFFSLGGFTPEMYFLLKDVPEVVQFWKSRTRALMFSYQWMHEAHKWLDSRWTFYWNMYWQSPEGAAPDPEIENWYANQDATVDPELQFPFSVGPLTFRNDGTFTVDKAVQEALEKESQRAAQEAAKKQTDKRPRRPQ